MKTLIAISVLSLAGCANFSNLKGTPDYDQCAYQAKAATPTTNSVLADVMREQELTNMCMKNKGYTTS